jgi:hypothetical protein
MNWIDSSLPWITELKEKILPERNEDKRAGPEADKKQEHNGEEEALPVETDSHIEAIQVPGVWKQDPNEIRWADLESKKKNSEIITMICTLK